MLQDLKGAGTMGVALLGYGTVGKAFFEMASERKDIKVKWLLALNAPDEIDCTVTDDFDDIINDPEVDTVVELIGGLHPSYEYVKKALHAGKNVVTANKWLMAIYYRDSCHVKYSIYISKINVRQCIVTQRYRFQGMLRHFRSKARE